MRIPKYYYYPTLPPYEPPPTVPQRLRAQLKKYKPLRLRRMVLALALGGCWWMGSAPAQDTLPTAAATPVPYADVSSEQRVILVGIDRGVASLGNRFTTEQIEQLRAEFEAACRQRNKALQDAFLGGKLLVNGKQTSEADAISREIDENTLTAFQRKYRLSPDEMSALTSGRMP